MEHTKSRRDIQSLEDIKLFVNEFYLLVQKDEWLAPVFESRINGHWQPHLDKMYLFWNAALFAEKGYIGNPFARHISLPLSAAHFERWLRLFSSVIDQYFEGNIAENAKWRAGMMAENFIRRLDSIRINHEKPIL